jgi:BirA family transcriptional regulator, biotin operon repressor / biotin---[acetyl-CoA-carboxylase] ligase
MSRDPTAQTSLRRHRLLALLSDGAFHSGEKLAKRLRISRGGIWKIISTLRESGIEIQSVPRQGYRLPRAVDLYDRTQILDAASSHTQSALVRTDVLLTVDSTNRFVTDISESLDAGCAQLCVAELQNAGRGRRGRSWMAPFGAGICMSVGWQFSEAPPTFSALSLAVGVAVVTALRKLGATDVGLKWPNDLLWKGRKLGGILIEMRGESAGPAHVVIGIGINMRMPTAIRLLLAEQQAAVIADVYEIMRERTPNRNVLVGAIVDELVDMLKTFATEGFAPFQSTWRDLDALANAPVKVINGAQTTQGLARGVDPDGTLLVDVGGEIRKFASGEVSLRAAPVR